MKIGLEDKDMSYSSAMISVLVILDVVEVPSLFVYGSACRTMKGYIRRFTGNSNPGMTLSTGGAKG